MQGYTEITQSELSRYAPNLLEALEAVCESPAFRTSPKSCEFLRHIVHNTLNGNTDVLKERLIGMTLLGREATYDTGSDAGVRVRANDVRKRLVSYRKEEGRVSSFTFDLPSGSYVPRFYRQTTLSLDTAAIDKVERYETDVPLSLQHLAAPTVIALFLCVICLRWQIAQEHPFTTFWQHVFQGHSVHLYLPPTERSGNDQLVAMQEVRDSAPLLNLAGQFHSQLNLSGDAETKEGDVLISIGTPSEIKAGTEPSQPTADDLSPPDTRRLTIINTTDGRRIFDRAVSKIYPARGNSAALLTISNSPTRSISIDGTDEASISSLVRLLCERDTFPEGLVDSMADGTTSQMVLSMTPGSQPVIFRDSPSEMQANSGKTQ
jgi:hypothetical protein